MHRRFAILLAALLAVLLGACEDTDVHTTPPAPIDSSGAPVVSVDPPVAGPNVAITVSGQGFPPDTIVELTVQRMTEGFTAEPLGQGQTDANGDVSLVAQVPALWLDGTPLSGPEISLELATEDGDIRGVAIVPFVDEELDSFLTIIPATGAPGQQVQLQGIGFEPGLDVVVRLGPAVTSLVAEDLATATTGASGDFEALVTLPAAWPDSGDPITEPSLIIALLDATDGTVLATAAFSNDPTQGTEDGPVTPTP